LITAQSFVDHGFQQAAVKTSCLFVTGQKVCWTQKTDLLAKGKKVAQFKATPQLSKPADVHDKITFFKKVSFDSPENDEETGGSKRRQSQDDTNADDGTS
jgi:hypothetical protein